MGRSPPLPHHPQRRRQRGTADAQYAGRSGLINIKRDDALLHHLTGHYHINPHGQWPQLKAAIKVVGHRETAAGAISQPRYYISSRAAPAGQLLAAVRSHWSIENSLHWTLDVTFREDQCRVRKAHGPQNLATLRQISHNLLKNENTLKVGIQGKRLNAGWREDYLLKVLLG